VRGSATRAATENHVVSHSSTYRFTEAKLERGARLCNQSGFTLLGKIGKIKRLYQMGR
jgi:hypothetical protein